MAYNFDDELDRITLELKKFVSKGTGLNCYTARTNFTPPNGAYATVYINNMTQAAMDHQKLYYNDEGLLVKAIHYILDVTVKVVHDTNPKAKLASLISRLETTYYRDQLIDDTGIGYQTNNGLSDASSVIDKNTWRNSAQTLMTFNTYIVFEADHSDEYIDKVNVNGDLIEYSE